MTLKEAHYDLRILEADKKHLVHCINTGNWEGYSEALKVRKQRLKKLESDITELTNLIKIL